MEKPSFSFTSHLNVALYAEISKENAVGHFIYEGTGRNDGTCQCSREQHPLDLRPSEQEDANAAFRIFAYNGNLQRAEKHSQKHAEYVNMCWATPLGKV